MSTHCLRTVRGVRWINHTLILSEIIQQKVEILTQTSTKWSIIFDRRSVSPTTPRPPTKHTGQCYIIVAVVVCVQNRADRRVSVILTVTGTVAVKHISHTQWRVCVSVHVSVDDREAVMNHGRHISEHVHHHDRQLQLSHTHVLPCSLS